MNTISKYIHKSRTFRNNFQSESHNLSCWDGALTNVVGLDKGLICVLSKVLYIYQARISTISKQVKIWIVRKIASDPYEAHSKPNMIKYYKFLSDFWLVEKVRFYSGNVIKINYMLLLHGIMHEFNQGTFFILSWNKHYNKFFFRFAKKVYKKIESLHSKPY